MLNVKHQVPFFESLVSLDLGLNLSLPDHWKTLYSLGQWPGPNMICYYIKTEILVPRGCIFFLSYIRGVLILGQLYILFVFWLFFHCCRI